MVNVVGGVVVFTVSAVVPIVVARAALSLVISLMSSNRATEPPQARPEPSGTTTPAVAH